MSKIYYRDKILEFYPGTGDKKYKVIIYKKNGKKIKTVQFGNKNFDQYYDNTPLKLYSFKDHLDKYRRRLYRDRHSKIKNNKGEYVHKIEFTPSWFSMNFLW